MQRRWPRAPPAARSHCPSDRPGAIASRFLPEPGEGPSEEAQEKGGFRIEFRSTLADGRVFGAEVIAKGEPSGYVSLRPDGLADGRRAGESGRACAWRRPRVPVGMLDDQRRPARWATHAGGAIVCITIEAG